MDAKALKKERKKLKTAITKFKTFLDNINSQVDKLEELKLRLVKIEPNLNEFEQIQGQLEQAESANETELEEHGEAYETAYYEAVGQAYTIIKELEYQQNTSIHSASTIHAQTITNVNLPKLSLPKFDGTYAQWLFFKDAFCSSIHHNTALSDVEKFRYLKSVLQGEALQLINSLVTTNENYTIAWDLLKQRYENHRIIVNSHMQALFEMQSVTKESSIHLRQIVDNFQMHVRALQALKESVQHWDTMLIYLLTNKLDSQTRRAWEHEIGEKSQLNPKLKELLDFLATRCQVLEMSDSKIKHTTDKSTYHKRTTSLATTKQICGNCRNNHYIFQCDQLLKLSPDKRMERAIQLRLCINCLKPNHFTRECLSKSRCRECGVKHNTLLHGNTTSLTKAKKEISRSEDNKQSDDETQQNLTSLSTTTVSYFVNKTQQQDVLLATAIVDVIDNQGRHHEARVALDAGSQISFIKQELIERLKLKCNGTSIPIQGISGISTTATRSAEVNIKSKFNKFNATVNCLVVKQITQPLPQMTINKSNLELPNVKLADPNFYITSEIDILIGGELFWNLLCVGRITLKKGQPLLQKTHLGWVIVGPIMCTEKPNKSVSTYHASIVKIQDQLEMFWKIEETSTKAANYSIEDLQCEENYAKTVTRDATGRFIVSLPQKQNCVLGNSQKGAMNRLNCLERKLSNNITLKREYDKFMQQYEELQHMTELEPGATKENTETFYLPHHAVIKTESLSTKVRVVFDGSFKSTNGISLNDKLLTGPIIQEELFNIVLRFRIHEYVITADIAMMFRQILIRPEDRNLQRICWRKSNNESIKHYTLNTVTYGTKSAPYLATRTLKQLALEDGNKFSKAKQVLESDFYMDDVLTGAHTIEDTIKLQENLNSLLLLGHFKLRKWRSNNMNILKHLKEESKTDELLIIDKQEEIKTLGLLWDSKQDTINYRIKYLEQDKITKRNILAQTATIFDPLGLLGPIIIYAKIILQKLWQLKLEWDEPVPQSIATAWQQFTRSLKNINEISIPRNVNPKNKTQKIILHGFCDASEQSYGACVYVYSQDKEEVFNSRLLCAKSKVAPLKIITLPRLELCGALILARLIQTVRQALADTVTQIYLWSDSTIVLSWIKMQPNHLKTFVSNRVAEIQRITSDTTWQHINSAENPADIISRGMSAEDLIQSQLWWQGPQWILNQWPDQQTYITDSPENELKIKPIILVSTENKFQILNNYSQFYKLQRVMAYCLKFIEILQAKRNKCEVNKQLTTKSLNHATLKIIFLTQQEAFQQEYIDLRNNRKINKKSPLFKLNAFLDENELIRLGGRLKHANVPDEHKYPYILPYSHHVTQLIVRQKHERLLHCGPEQLLASVRTNYWPLCGRRLARKIVHNCITCVKHHPIPIKQIMGTLPETRVNATNRPFVITGVDYAGPIQLVSRKGRGRKQITKAYIAVFVCFTTKAVHLELVTELTTEAFLAALRRFCARRGICSKIYSDNATNFVGARNKLKDIYEFLKSNNREIADDLLKQSIEWHFIPPRSPNFGGIWEIAVKSMKNHFYKVTKNLMLTYEECYTLLTEIEAILNSRPLTPNPSDPTDTQPITPSHFLIGDLLIEPPQVNLTEIQVNKLSSWEHLQKVKQHFWQRWKREYLHQLQVRQRWHERQHNIQVGDLVIIMEDNTPPLKWSTGRVTDIYPGDDDVVRVVNVKSGCGIIKRPVRKLCVLPVDSASITN